MLQKLNWPTAAVLGIFLAGYVVLIIVGKDVPTWMAAAGGMLGSVVLAWMESLSKGGGGP